jgi:hypothetical protein
MQLRARHLVEVAQLVQEGGGIEFSDDLPSAAPVLPAEKSDAYERDRQGCEEKYRVHALIRHVIWTFLGAANDSRNPRDQSS